MGKNNSSEIRVAPFGEKLVENHDMVNSLLHLVGCSRINFGEFSNNDIYFSGNNANIKKGEKALNPPKEHLKGIIDLIYSDAGARDYFKEAVEKTHPKDEMVKENRLKLAACDYNLEYVYQEIENNNKWAILEGASKPDLFIESDRFILIVEGKLTEPHTTKSTTYLMKRNQMLRHIQGAIEYNKKNKQDKKIIAFYIVPDTFSEIKEIKNKDSFDEVINVESVKITDQEYKDLIKSCYYGCTTWEKIEKKFKIEFRAIIE